MDHVNRLSKIISIDSTIFYVFPIAFAHPKFSSFRASFDPSSVSFNKGLMGDVHKKVN